MSKLINVIKTKWTGIPNEVFFDKRLDYRMVGCGDDKPSGEKDAIIGTWIGQSDENGVTRYFYAEIKKSTKEIYAKYDIWFAIDAKAVFTTGKSENLTKSDMCYYSETKTYTYAADFSPLPHFGDKQKYQYDLNMDGKDKFVITGEEERSNSKLNAIYNFERTTLTLEQYQEQLKVA